jgi:uncharacterized protein with von Willebrand factor type A (vWA) domain
MGAKGWRVAVDRLCDRCMGCENTEDRTLYDLAHLDDKTIDSLVSVCKFSMEDLYEKACESARYRKEQGHGSMQAKGEELRGLNEEFSHKLLHDLLEGENFEKLMEEYLQDKDRQQLENDISMIDEHDDGIDGEDIKNGLREYLDKDLLEIDGEGVRVTLRGSRRLAQYVLRRIWDNLTGPSTGTNMTREEGFGVTQTSGRRKYEYGDEFFRVDLEHTLMAALERRPRNDGLIEFEEEDVWVKETSIDTRMCIGLLVDESGSMSGEKMHAAMDIAVGLAQLINGNAKDRMRLLLFSNQVREAPYWDIMNMTFAGGTTDIRAALRRFRTLVSSEQADKQVYLITDTEPNCEDGKYIGFEKATAGLLREALFYQREGITLNIIMLDNTPRLREFASILAKRNLGRVFFAEPKDLGLIVVEDYLRTKRRQKMRKAM